MQYKLIFCLISAFWWHEATAQSNDTNHSGKFATFSNKLFQIAESSNPGNVAISPYSIQEALLLLYEGSSGRTADDVSAALNLTSISRVSIISAHRQLYKDVGESNLFRLANKLFIAPSYSLKPAFTEVAVRVFNSEVSSMDFSNSGYAAREINTWVDQRTNGKIRNIFQPTDVASDTKMVLANAIYFKGIWEEQFNARFTSKAAFWTSGHASNEVDTMFGRKNCKNGYFPDKNLEAIELPFKDSDISMMILLPEKRDAIATLMNDIHNLNVVEISANMTKSSISLWLPKFKIETELNLVPLLSKMGITTMFTSYANFEDLLETTEPLSVSKAVHKAFIEVDEKGAEASAASGLSAIPIRADPEFRADHPFVYVIKSSKAVLFMGCVKVL